MLVPIAKNIIIKPIEETHGVLIIKNSKPSQFRVISIGDEVTKVLPNDIIYLQNHYGIEIEYEKEKFLIVKEDSILAKLD